MRSDVRRGVCKKSAQVGWTQAVILNFLGWLVHIRRGTAIVMFPKAGAATAFNLEKFEPMVEGTPELAEIIPTKSRSKNVTQLFKNFIGGFLKFVGSNSIADVKSTSARFLIVEEPDDCNANLRGQGDAIKLLDERGKSYRDSLLLIGGTPSIKGVSSMDDEFAKSNQCYWYVPCPDCGEFQPLRWEQVLWQKDETRHDPIYGHHLPDTARYCCEHCGSLWSDTQKNAAIRAGKAVETAPFRGVLGLALNELYSQMHDSRLQRLAEKFIHATNKLKTGDASEMIVFFNATLGESWEFKDGLTNAEELAERGEDYPPMEIQRGGLILTAGVDVQTADGGRLAVTMRAYGRGEESWQVQWTEIPGNPLDLEPRDDNGNRIASVWDKLDRLLFAPVRHVDGFYVRTSAVSIDSGDGNTSDAVYSWVRSRRKKHPMVDIMAIKGHKTPGVEVFSRPKPVLDTTHDNSRAKRYGLRVFMVGVSKAKDLLIGANGRLSLDGVGPGRFHFSRHVRSDYCKQLLSERKLPKRVNGQYTDEMVWQKVPGVRNEALDTEVYALHAARARKVHLMSDSDWARLEQELRQQGLFESSTGKEPSDDDGGNDDDDFEPLQATSMYD
ncbi:terminase [Pseudogulbenkiania ferrooxidans EGD-HP2]|uniref:Terminase n=2 Tax=Pseudogulbenkiania ferrooxidans TaxID=549169 RepID=A0ABN0N7K5_9NEIS|nr:terminase [Pseudogulbenkiania ferrooxidans EGD-HP2]